LSGVDESFAFDEGEGDRTLAIWRGIHEDLFARHGGFDPDMLQVYERFRGVEVVSPALHTGRLAVIALTLAPRVIPRPYEKNR